MRISAVILSVGRYCWTLMCLHSTCDWMKWYWMSMCLEAWAASAYHETLILAHARMQVAPSARFLKSRFAFPFCSGVVGSVLRLYAMLVTPGCNTIPNELSSFIVSGGHQSTCRVLSLSHGLVFLKCLSRVDSSTCWWVAWSNASGWSHL